MVQQIGNRLVRNIGNNKTVVTETLNGQTFTNVLENGKTCVERVAENVKNQVGNKTVFTRAKVTRYFDEFGGFEKEITDRVYKDNIFLGTRNRLYAPAKSSKRPYTSIKETPEKYVKRDFGINGITEKIIIFDEKTMSCSDSAKIDCNNKGLPMPIGLSHVDAANKSIKEMRIMHFNQNPHLPYQDKLAGLKHLDSCMPETPTLNDLHKYL